MGRSRGDQTNRDELLLLDSFGIYMTKEQKEILKDFDLLAALILDCTAINLKASETHREDFLHKFQSVSRGLCYALHCRRFSLLNNMNNSISVN